MSGAYDDAGRSLQNSRLYVDPAAERELEAAGTPFGGAAQDEARRVLDGASTPVYVAVLPSSAAADQNGLGAIANAVGDDATYIAVFPDLTGKADSLLLDRSAVMSAAEQSAVASDDVGQFISDVVPRLDEVAADEGAAGSGTGSSGGGWLPLAILAAAGGGGFLLYRRNKLSKERAQLEQVRGALEDDITTYGEQLSALDLDVQPTSAVPIEARDEYGRALDLYEQAKVYSERAEKPSDLKPVTHALEEGRWLLGCVEARLKHEPLPERRLPCFFDPGHGPSAEDVEWAPPGGAPRLVPACAADALRVKNGADPSIRMVPVGGDERRPYWDAGPAYGGWAGGYYGGVLPGMLMGTMLGSALSGPMYADGGQVGGDFGGDFGGGDFGGDFGGGFGGDF